jgi:hypothetical protein
VLGYDLTPTFLELIKPELKLPDVVEGGSLLPVLEYGGVGEVIVWAFSMAANDKTLGHNTVTEGLYDRPKAPRGGLNPNRGFVELGAFRTNRLRRLPEIELFKWNSTSDQIRQENESAKPKRDRMRLAHHYQSLLDSGQVETRAELARFLRVSRARVTQVLNRLRTE